MNEHHTNPSDEIVGRAIDALRTANDGADLPPELLARTVDALRNSVPEFEPNFLQRIHAMPWTTKMATIVAMAATVLAGYVGIAGFGGARVVLADVAERLRDAKTMSFEITLHPVKGEQPPTKVHVWQMQPDKMRADVESTMGKATLIVDPSVGKTVLLSPLTKTAITGDFKTGDVNMQQSVLNNLREMAENKDARPLGKRDFDGVLCEGFEVAKAGKKFTIWADSKTGDPVLAEFPVITMPAPFGDVRTVLNHFKLDDPIDPAMFSVDPPEGYMVIKNPFTLDLEAKPSERIVKILSIYAKRTEGQFPERLDDWGRAAQEKLFAGQKEPPKDSTQFSQEILALGTYFLGHEEGKDYQYLPGAKLGEKDRIVFWYRDKKTEKYTAVYGDLRVGEIQQDQLPAVPPKREESPPSGQEKQQQELKQSRFDWTPPDKAAA